MQDYPVLYQALVSNEVWRSQKIGIAKAMRIIQDQGRVLMADPTGSGKAKFATALAYTLFHWLWENGLKDRSTALVISPPQVMDNWERELEPFKVPNKIESMGTLSLGEEKKRKQLQRDIETKDILIIDEAHNYLRSGSKRTRSISPRSATHVILSTATPINKRPEDLLRLIELLDIDNLSDADILTYKKLRRNRARMSDKNQLDMLKNYINQFIVRSTKKELNRMIAREPELYKNWNVHKCRFPTTTPTTYNTGETDDDKQIATKIYTLPYSLKGIHYLMSWEFPLYCKTTEERKIYIFQRFSSAVAMAAFMTRSCLRSSDCAFKTEQETER